MSSPIKKYQEFNFPYAIEDIEDSISDYLDSSRINILRRDQRSLQTDFYSRYRMYHIPVYINGERIETWYPNDITLVNPGLYLEISIPHPHGMKGSLDCNGYTRSLIGDYFKRFINMSNSIVDTSLYYFNRETNGYKEPLSINILKFEFGT